MNELQIFENEEFGQVRVVEMNNEPWFVASDVCKVLEHSNPSVAMRMLEDDERTKLCLGRAGETNFVNESGLYALILKSNMPRAKTFRKWVTSEILPSIRKNGGYIAHQGEMTEEQIMASAILVAQKVIANKDKQIAELQPKAEFFDAVADSKDAITMNDVAKVLAIPGYGRNNLFEFLRSNNVLMADNRPYQKYIDRGWFRTVEQKYTKGVDVCINIKTLVFQKGVDGIRQMIKAKETTGVVEF